MDITSIKNFNARLNQHKASAQKIQTQIELMEQDVKTKLANLSQLMGQEVNETNIQQIYTSLSEELERQLNNGSQILDNIESQLNGTAQAPMVANANMAQPQMQAVGVQAQQGVFAQQAVAQPQQPYQYGQVGVGQVAQGYGQPVAQPIGQQYGQPVGQPVGQTVGQPVGQPMQNVEPAVQNIGNFNTVPESPVFGGVIGV